MTWMTIINFIVWLIVAGILWWAINAILAKLSPWIAEPFNTLIQCALILLIAFILISAITQLAGMSFGPRLPMIR